MVLVFKFQSIDTKGSTLLLHTLPKKPKKIQPAVTYFDEGPSSSTGKFSGVCKPENAGNPCPASYASHQPQGRAGHAADFCNKWGNCSF